jgi:hypothetical protein
VGILQQKKIIGCKLVALCLINEKMLKLKILVASSLIFCFSYLVYLLANSINNSVNAQSPAIQTQSAPNKFPSTELQKVLDNAVKTQNIPGAAMYFSTPQGQ